MANPISRISMLTLVCSLLGASLGPVSVGAAQPRRETRVVVVREAPPPARARAQRPRPPRNNVVWVEGHWAWNGRRHVWREGHYTTARPGYVYVQPRWERRADGWVYWEGRWERHDGRRDGRRGHDHDHDHDRGRRGHGHRGHR